MADVTDENIARIIRRTVREGSTSEMDDTDRFMLLLRLSAIGALGAIQDTQLRNMLARTIEAETQV